LKLKKDGLADITLRGLGRRLRLLSEKCDLENPESIKSFIANLNCSSEYKLNLVNTYDHFAKFRKISWEKPRYRKRGALKKVPLEQNVDFIIEHASFKKKVAFTLIKEYGLRPVELAKLTTKDMDLEQGLLYIKTAKYGNPREFKLKPKDVALLNLLLIKIKPDLIKRLFACPDTLSHYWHTERRKAYVETGNPEFLKIRLYDLRHFFATKLYHSTKDLLYVMQQLGHRNIQNTLVYTHLVNFGSDEFHSAVAKNLQEACKLIEEGFEYVTEIDGVKLFRKRK
jgi:integrase